MIFEYKVEPFQFLKKFFRYFHRKSFIMYGNMTMAFFGSFGAISLET